MKKRHAKTRGVERVGENGAPPLTVSEYGELSFAEGHSEGFIAGLRVALRVVPMGQIERNMIREKIRKRTKTHRRKFPLSEAI